MNTGQVGVLCNLRTWSLANFYSGLRFVCLVIVRPNAQCHLPTCHPLNPLPNLEGVNI